MGKDKFLLIWLLLIPFFPSWVLQRRRRVSAASPEPLLEGTGSENVASPARRVREDEKCTKNGNFCQLGNKNLRGFN